MGGRDGIAKGIVKQFCAEGGSLKKGLNRELESDDPRCSWSQGRPQI